MQKKYILLFILACFAVQILYAQDAMQLVSQVKAKLEKVKDYSATGVMKTDVVFIKAPVSKIKVYYKSPDRFRLKKDGGISLLPKGGVSVNVGNLISVKDFTAIDAGEQTIDNTPTRIIKLLPSDNSSEIVLSTLYIDPKALLVKKAVTTTITNGTYDMQMTYGKYAAYALPDKVVFSFNTKDYKLPKGITMEMDEGKDKTMDKLKNKKGKVEITYNSYIINAGFSDDVFK